MQKHLVRYRPLEDYPALWETFSQIKTREDAIGFVRKFGPLTKAGLRDKGEVIEEIEIEAERMQDGHTIPLIKLEARIDHGQLTIKPDNLLEALWLQYMEAKSKGGAKRCRQCKRLFASTPEPGRRPRTKFCSEECKTKYHSLARSRH